MAFSTWLHSPYAQQYLEYEDEHLKNALRQVSGPRVLLLGNVINTELFRQVDFPQLIMADLDGQNSTQSTLMVDPAFLPIQAETVATVVVPHVLERHTLPHQVLRETQRVLVPEGHIILTGFNPVSAIGLQRLLFRKAVCPGNYLSVKRVADWLQLLDFEIVASASFAYAPLINNPRLRRFFQFLNPLGNRWLPMLGGGYMITARKRQPGSTLVGRLNFNRSVVKKRRGKLAVAKSSDGNKTHK